MKFLLALSSLLLATPSFAAAVNMDPGPVSHDLYCQAAKQELGMLHSLEVVTLKDGQDVNVQSMRFIEKVAFSRGSATVTNLNSQAQDAASATFVSDRLTVTLQKDALSADVYEGSQLAYHCK